LNFPIGDHLAGSKHARRVKAAIQEKGDDYTAFLQVMATAWLPLEGQDFNTVSGIFRPRADANSSEVYNEEQAEFRLEVYIPPPHSSGTMVHDGIDLIGSHYNIPLNAFQAKYMKKSINVNNKRI
jgi:hypothetical protein